MPRAKPPMHFVLYGHCRTTEELSQLVLHDSLQVESEDQGVVNTVVKELWVISEAQKKYQVCEGDGKPTSTTASEQHLHHRTAHRALRGSGQPSTVQ
jgi:hypothetical protein